MKIRVYMIFLLGTMLYSTCKAQFSPPGLGDAKAASWLAVGIKQNLNEKGNVSSATHFGSGRISNPDNYNLFDKQSIYVFNEEVTHHFKKNWKYSGAISYRWQNKYKPTEPYELDNPHARQELRLYSRFAYLNSFKNIDYSLGYRPELRLFYNPDFVSAAKNRQFRSRFRGKASFNLNASKTMKIVTSAELLFSTTRSTEWSKFEYQETRFCLYYSFLFPKQKITLNLGYMNDLIGKSSQIDVNYLAFDLLINNPFER